MWVADHGRFSNFGVQHQRAFHFGSAHAVSGDIKHIVDASGDPVVAILIATGAVAGKVVAGEGTEIGIDKPLVIAVDGANLARPAGLNRQHTLYRALELIALLVEQHWLDTKEWTGRRAGLECGGAGQRRQHVGAGLGLPPGVDDRAAAVANHFVVPLPSLWVDRLADGAEQLQRAARGLRHQCIAGRHQ